MNFAELIKRPCLRETYSVYALKGPLSVLRSKNDVDHVFSTEIENYFNDVEELLEQEKKILTKFFIDTPDDKWGICLAVVWFEDTPLFAFTRQGRYQCDKNVFIFDAALFDRFIAYVRTFFSSERNQVLAVPLSQCEVPLKLGAEFVETLLKRGAQCP